MKEMLLAVLLAASLLVSCGNDLSTDGFVVDDMYCSDYPENCLPNENTGKPEVYCGKNHDGVRCECEVDRVGRPMAVRECNVWSR